MADKLSRSRVRSAWVFLAPTLIVLALVAAWPLLRTIWYGFTDTSLLEMEKSKWVGLDNYTGKGGLLHNKEWWQAVRNTLWFTLLTVSIETVLGTIIALVLHRSFPGRGLVRAAVLIPWAIPTIVSARMWSWMLNDQFGIINHMLLGLGIIDTPKAWTADLAMTSIVLVDVWKTTPFMSLLILAALQMLPKECYEAAQIDGVHPVKVFFRVTLPLIRPALMVAVIFRALDAVRVFDLVYVLTTGTKDMATMSIYARQQLIDFNDVGYGSAASTLLFFIVALLTILYIFVGRVKLGDK
ncbi:MAG TPA: sugar ABC transporter permease [Kofleriaceae bacterium]|nr:sugar ABC transporter permease [Kofleriaceae bacterium]